MSKPYATTWRAEGARDREKGAGGRHGRRLRSERRQAPQSFSQEGSTQQVSHRAAVDGRGGTGWAGGSTHQTSGLQARGSCVDTSHSRNCLVIVDEPLCVDLHVWRIRDQVLLSAKTSARIAFRAAVKGSPGCPEPWAVSRPQISLSSSSEASMRQGAKL